MSKEKPAPARDYATPLLEFVTTTEPTSEPPEPLKKRRGPKKKLVKQQLGRFFRAIAEISSTIKNRSTYLSIAAELKQMQEYSGESERNLRRKVSIALDIIGDRLSECPANSWEKVFGISPPSSKAKKLLREKTLEFLRHQLGQNK